MKTIELHTPDSTQVTVDYQDDYILVLHDIHSVDHVMHETIRTGFFMIVLVEQGQGTSIINQKELQLKQGDLLLCTPGNFIKSGMVSTDFRSRIFLATPAYTENLIKDSRLDTVRYLIKDSFIAVSLTPVEHTIIRNYYSLIASYGDFSNEELRKRCVKKLLQAFSTALTVMMWDHGILQPAGHISAADTMFRVFLKTLREHPEGRSVQFYANKLNITPKYFNSICKQVTGKTASTLINEELVSQAKIMLRDPELSVKQVASTLGFTNQSHFGTFMRRETGHSPQFWRKSRPEQHPSS